MRRSVGHPARAALGGAACDGPFPAASCTQGARGGRGPTGTRPVSTNPIRERQPPIQNWRLDGWGLEVKLAAEPSTCLTARHLTRRITRCLRPPTFSPQQRPVSLSCPLRSTAKLHLRALACCPPDALSFFPGLLDCLGE